MASALRSKEATVELYRSILRLHRTKLPPKMRGLGDTYVKAEFRLHRSAKPQFLGSFFKAWDGYAESLRQRTSVTGFGAPLGEEVGKLTDDQRSMLAKLATEARELGK